MKIKKQITFISVIDQLRLDWISKNWYFLVSEPGVIFVCTQNMKFCTIVVEKYWNKPENLELDPTKG